MITFDDSSSIAFGSFLYFFATWCGPCVAFKPIFEKVSSDLKNVNFMNYTKVKGTINWFYKSKIENSDFTIENLQFENYSEWIKSQIDINKKYIKVQKKINEEINFVDLLNNASKNDNGGYNPYFQANDCSFSLDISSNKVLVFFLITKYCFLTLKGNLAHSLIPIAFLPYI